MKNKICSLCGEELNRSHHCSGKKAYAKGYKEGTDDARYEMFEKMQEYENQKKSKIKRGKGGDL